MVDRGWADQRASVARSRRASVRPVVPVRRRPFRASKDGGALIDWGWNGQRASRSRRGYRRFRNGNQPAAQADPSMFSKEYVEAMTKQHLPEALHGVPGAGSAAVAIGLTKKAVKPAAVGAYLYGANALGLGLGTAAALPFAAAAGYGVYRAGKYIYNLDRGKWVVDGAGSLLLAVPRYIYNSEKAKYVAQGTANLVLTAGGWAVYGTGVVLKKAAGVASDVLAAAGSGVWNVASRKAAAGFTRLFYSFDPSADTNSWHRGVYGEDAADLAWELAKKMHFAEPADNARRLLALFSVDELKAMVANNTGSTELKSSVQAKENEKFAGAVATRKQRLLYENDQLLETQRSAAKQQFEMLDRALKAAKDGKEKERLQYEAKKADDEYQKLRLKQPDDKALEAVATQEVEKQWKRDGESLLKSLGHAVTFGLFRGEASRRRRPGMGGAPSRRRFRAPVGPGGVPDEAAGYGDYVAEQVFRPAKFVVRSMVDGAVGGARYARIAGRLMRDGTGGFFKSRLVGALGRGAWATGSVLGQGAWETGKLVGQGALGTAKLAGQGVVGTAKAISRGAWWLGGKAVNRVGAIFRSYDPNAATNDWLADKYGRKNADKAWELAGAGEARAGRAKALLTGLAEERLHKLVPGDVPAALDAIAKTNLQYKARVKKEQLEESQRLYDMGVVEKATKERKELVALEESKRKEAAKAAEAKAVEEREKLSKLEQEVSKLSGAEKATAEAKLAVAKQQVATATTAASTAVARQALTPEEILSLAASKSISDSSKASDPGAFNLALHASRRPARTISGSRRFKVMEASNGQRFAAVFDDRGHVVRSFYIKSRR